MRETYNADHKLWDKLEGPKVKALVQNQFNKFQASYIPFYYFCLGFQLTFQGTICPSTGTNNDEVGLD